MTTIPFHSGKRLRLAIELGGFTQETILDQQQFPKTAGRNLQRWLRAGVPNGQIRAVAKFFGLTAWSFEDDRISENEFRMLLSDPGNEKALMAKFLNPPADDLSPEPPGPTYTEQFTL